jgi:hypothetical protein
MDFYAVLDQVVALLRQRQRVTLYAKLGLREQARPALSAAIALYRAMDMTFWLPQAEAVLAQTVNLCPQELLTEGQAPGHHAG